MVLLDQQAGLKLTPDLFAYNITICLIFYLYFMN